MFIAVIVIFMLVIMTIIITMVAVSMIDIHDAAYYDNGPRCLIPLWGDNLVYLVSTISKNTAARSERIPKNLWLDASDRVSIGSSRLRMISAQVNSDMSTQMLLWPLEPRLSGTSACCPGGLWLETAAIVGPVHDRSQLPQPLQTLSDPMSQNDRNVPPFLEQNLAFLRSQQR